MQQNSFDRTVKSLCRQIDNLEEEVLYWKELYEKEVQESIQQSNNRIIEAQKGVANALMFALSVHDDENGNLVIGREERKELAKNWR